MSVVTRAVKASKVQSETITILAVTATVVGIAMLIAAAYFILKDPPEPSRWPDMLIGLGGTFLLAAIAVFL
jgi:hypothetical protein